MDYPYIAEINIQNRFKQYFHILTNLRHCVAGVSSIGTDVVNRLARGLVLLGLFFVNFVNVSEPK